MLATSHNVLKLYESCRIRGISEESPGEVIQIPGPEFVGEYRGEAGDSGIGDPRCTYVSLVHCLLTKQQILVALGNAMLDWKLRRW